MQLPRDMQHSWNKMYEKYSADTVICTVRKTACGTVLFKLPCIFILFRLRNSQLSVCSFETILKI